mgnify:CR=1 FL=1
MSMVRKLKRKRVLDLVGKCRKCQHAYTERATKMYCPTCRRDGEFLNFKRKTFK